MGQIKGAFPFFLMVAGLNHQAVRNTEQVVSVGRPSPDEVWESFWSPLLIFQWDGVSDLYHLIWQSRMEMKNTFFCEFTHLSVFRGCVISLIRSMTAVNALLYITIFNNIGKTNKNILNSLEIYGKCCHFGKKIQRASSQEQLMRFKSMRKSVKHKMKKITN